MKEKIAIRPVVCICQVNGTVGVVLRKDYDDASERFWHGVKEAESAGTVPSASKPGVMHLRVTPTFVFKSGSDKIRELLKKCYVEEAAFLVPIVPHSLVDDSKAALEYLFKPEHESRCSIRYLSKERIHTGHTVKVIEARSGKEIDQAAVASVGYDEKGGYKEISLKSKGKDAERTEMTFFPAEGIWRVLDRDPMGGGRTYSQRHPGYFLQVEERSDWVRLVEEVNMLHGRLDQKPRHLKAGYHASPAGILNAYREGDLDFAGAVAAIQSLKK